MGWERKRGKLEELNRLLRGATDTSFAVQIGEVAVLPRVRYCITLDSDTRLPRDAAQEADRDHRPPPEPPPLRPPPRARDRGLRDPAAAGERDHGQRGRLALRPHLRRPHRRRPLHHRGVGHLPGPVRRGDLHRQGPLRRGRVHGGAGGTGARERASVPRPVRGTLRARRPGHRTWRSSTTIPPASSPTRGASTAGCGATGSSCGGFSRWCPSRSGLPAEPPAPHLALEDLRQPAAQPGGSGHRVALFWAWTPAPGSPAVWTAAVLAALAFPLYPLLLEAACPPPQPSACLRMRLREWGKS